MNPYKPHTAKIITGLMIMFMLLSTIAAADWDNVKPYDEAKREYTIKNWLGFGETLAKYKLESNTELCSGWGCEAKGIAKLYIPSRLFTKLEFEDKEGKETIIQNKIYIWEENIIEEEIDTYKQVCSKETYIKYGKEVPVCVGVKNGAKIITRDKSYWKIYNGEVLSEGSYKWKIKGNVPAGMEVDWIGSAVGEKFTKWAWWNSDFEFCHNLNVTNNYETLDDFPVFINLNSTVNTRIQTATWGYSRFVNKSCENDGSSLPYEFDYNDTTNAGFWVTNTEFINGENAWSIYIDSDTGVNPVETPEDVFANNYTGIWHFNENWTDSLGRMNCSMAGGTDPTFMTTECAFGNCLRFPGTDTHLRCENNAVQSTTPSFLEFWGNTSAGSDQMALCIPAADSTWSDPWTDSCLYSNAGNIAWEGNVGDVSKGAGQGTAKTGLSQRATQTYFSGGYDGSITKFYNDSKAVNIGDIADGTINYAPASQFVFGSRAGNGGYWNGQIDEVRQSQIIRSSGWVNRTIDNTDLTMIQFGAEIEGTSVTATQSFPINNFNSTIDTINISCNFSSGGTALIDTVRLDVYDSGDTLDYTNTEDITDATTYNKTWITSALTDDVYNWACSVVGDGGELSSSNNRTLTVHTRPPSISIIAPSGNLGSLSSGQSLDLSWNITEPGQNVSEHVLNCTYTYNSVITNLNKTDCIVVNLTTFSYIGGIDTLSMSVTDQFNLMTTNTTTWTSTFTEITQSYANETTEGNLESFQINVSVETGKTITRASLYYNGTRSDGSISNTAGDNYTLTEAITIPNIESDINVTFLWEIELNDGVIGNSSKANQSVKALNLDNCTDFSEILINMTILNEELQTLLTNTSLETAINIYDRSGSINVVNYSNSSTLNPYSLCMNQNLPNNSLYLLDVVIKYKADFFATEYHNIINASITNNSFIRHIELFDLNLSDSTEFRLTFTGSDFLPTENALVFVDREYIDENIFKTVELPKTDSNGQTILHLVRNDVRYNLRIVKNGAVLGNFENIIAFCDDFTIGNCQIELNAFSSTENLFNYDEDLGIIFTIPKNNETLDTISFDYTSSDGTAKEVTIEVTRNDIFGNRTICTNSITASSGTLICHYNASLEDTNLRTNVLVGNELIATSQVIINSGDYGEAGYLIFFLMIISFILMFSGSKTGVLWGILLGFATGIGLGLVSSSMFGLASSGIYLIVIVLIGLWQLNKGKSQ